MSDSAFVYFVCQAGTEPQLKREIIAQFPHWKLAFSRPGFLTMKTGVPATRQLNLKSTFARTFGWSLQRLSGNDAMVLAEQAAELFVVSGARQLHVWQRDSNIPGERGYEPFTTSLAEEIAQLILAAIVRRGEKPPTVNRPAKPISLVFDVALVEPGQWWLGQHHVNQVAQQWPGGVPCEFQRSDVISRAYYKLAEALLWSHMTIRKGDVCTELGSAPGGAVQRMLEFGARVIAVDPAELDEALQNHPQVTHLRMRTRQIPKKEIAGTRWLFADLNVAPDYTLAALEDIVQHRATKVQGLVATLKMTDWKLAEHLETYRQRVKSWGFKMVQTRQLAFGRQEICLVAFRDRFTQRADRRSNPRSTKLAPSDNLTTDNQAVAESKKATSKRKQPSTTKPPSLDKNKASNTKKKDSKAAAKPKAANKKSQENS